MSKVLVTESYLSQIANAIRSKLGGSTEYRPGDMGAAILSIPTGGITPTGTVNIAQNGTHDVTQYASANVNVQPNLQSKTANQNGTVTPDQGYDGLSSVVVNVSGGGGSSYPVIDAIFNGGLGDKYGALYIQGTTYPDGLSQGILTFMSNYARSPYGTAKDGSSMETTVQITSAIAQESVQAFKARFGELTQAEYYGYVTSDMITALELVELGRDTASGSSISLSDSIENYSALVMQGIYGGTTVTSNYNTTMLYINPQLNKQYWVGMKDRNRYYDRYVTFTDTTTGTLSGGSSSRGIIIWGLP